MGVKITVNICGKSKGNYLCFELAGNSNYRGFEYRGLTVLGFELWGLKLQ